MLVEIEKENVQEGDFITLGKSSTGLNGESILGFFEKLGTRKILRFIKTFVIIAMSSEEDLELRTLGIRRISASRILKVFREVDDVIL